MSFIYNMLDTWNAVGTTFNSILMNASNGAGGAPVGSASSRLLNLQNNSRSALDVSINGNVGVTDFSAVGGGSGSSWNTFVFGIPTGADQRLGFLASGARNSADLGANLGTVMEYFSDGAWTAGVSQPAYIRFRTCPSGSATMVEALRIASTGFVGIGLNTNPAFALEVQKSSVAFEIASYHNPNTTGCYAQYVDSVAIVKVGCENGKFAVRTNDTVRMNIDTAGNKFMGVAALATNATDGFLNIPSCAGQPTGTPTLVTGMVPMIFDTVNSQFWFYTSGAWKQPKTPAAAALITWQ